jgi:hypothetical protein
MAQAKRTTRISQKAAQSRFPDDPEDRPTEVGQAVLDALLAPTGAVQDTETVTPPVTKGRRRLTPEARARRLAGPVRVSDKVGYWQCYSCTTEGKGTEELLKHTRKTGHSEFEDVTRRQTNG